MRSFMFKRQLTSYSFHAMTRQQWVVRTSLRRPLQAFRSAPAVQRPQACKSRSLAGRALPGLVACLLLLLSLAASLQAQQYTQLPTMPNPLTTLNNTGIQVYGIYDGTHETVGLDNGNLHLVVPLLHLPQRGGGTLDINAIYDSVAEHQVNTTFQGYVGSTAFGGVIRDVFSLDMGYDQTDVLPYLPGSWRLGLPTLSSKNTIVLSQAVASDLLAFVSFTGANSRCDAQWTMTTADGSKHAFSNQRNCTAGCVDNLAGNCILAPTRNISDTTDGTYMRLDTTNQQDIVCTTRMEPSFTSITFHRAARLQF